MSWREFGVSCDLEWCVSANEGRRSREFMDFFEWKIWEWTGVVTLQLWCLGLGLVWIG
jgi:hypothetical protein